MEQYNPLAYDSLGDAITSAFLQQPLEPITDFTRRNGSGLYGLYYFGDDPVYELLVNPPSAGGAGQGLQIPIYVGSSIPRSRQGFGTDEEDLVVAARLRTHLKSLTQVGLADQVKVRYLTLNPAWAILAEAHLIKMFQPVWNVVITGLGNNSPGSGRTGQRLSRWDTMHPGRRPGRDAIVDHAQQIRQQATDHLAEYFRNVYPLLLARLRPAFIRTNDGPCQVPDLPSAPPTVPEP